MTDLLPRRANAPGAPHAWALGLGALMLAVPGFMVWAVMLPPKPAESRAPAATASHPASSSAARATARAMSATYVAFTTVSVSRW